jgi:prepilin-type N-terminal cleavage/methylation domain-containing protein
MHRPHPILAAGGFTLVELIIVCVVLAILSVSVTAAMGNLSGQRRAAAARQLQADLTFARQRAVATSLRTWVVFDTTADTYQVRVESLATPGFAAASVMIDPATRAPFTTRLSAIAPEADLTAAAFDSQPAVGFDYLGRPLATSGSLLAAAGTVSMSGGFTITVSPSTGLITLSP